MSELRCYSSDQINHVWPDVKHHIESALDRGSNYTIHDIRIGLCTQQMQLWCYGTDAALVTTIQEKDGIKFCLYLALGGSKMDEWGKYQPLVEDWARENGCTEMRVYGRRGWKQFGFEEVYTKLRKH